MLRPIKKILFIGLILGILLPKFALAQERLARGAIEGLAAYVNSITLFFVEIAAYFSEAALVMSLNIVNSSAVQQGFTIALTLANLGFVIAIIVIALATIFRNQTYGVKRALIRLVVMAILVNFSLILTGVVLNFTDRLTLYFVSASSPNGFGDTVDFSKRIMDTVGSQALQKPPPKTPNAVDDAFAGMVNALLGSVFNVLTLLAFVVLAATLFVRYTFISILLIAMPLAWLSWIFPATSGWWKKWWDNFIKWTFYAPALMFFVYIAMTLAQSDALPNALSTTQSSEIANALGQKLVRSETLASLSRQITILFVLFGGFFAAKSMGIGMAGSIQAGAQAVGKKMWGATKRRGIQYGTAGFRKKNEAGKSLAERTRTWAQGRTNPAARIAAGWLAQGVTKLETAGGERLIKDYEKDVAKMSDTEAQAALLSTLPGPRRVAILKKLIKNKKLSGAPLDLVLNESTKKLMADFGQAGEFNNIEKQFMMSQGMYKAIKDNDSDEMRKERTKFFKSLGKGDVANMQFNDIFSGKDKLGLKKEELEKYAREIAVGLISDAPQLVPNIIPKMKGEAGEIFKEMYEDAAHNEITRLEKEADEWGSLDERSRDNMEKTEKIRQALDNFEKKIWANNAVFGGGEDKEEKSEKKEETKEPAPAKAA